MPTTSDFTLTRRLLGFRWRALSRRVRGPAIAVVVVAVAIAAGAALVLLGDALTAAGTEETTIRDQVFWLGTIAALIYSYTTFEVFFRAPDARFIGALPLSGAARFDDLFVRALLVHLPLALPIIAYAGALGAASSSQPGAAAGALYALVVGLTQFLVGITLAIALHLYAGRSLLTPSSELRKVLAGVSVPDDAALLVYAPALALFGTLVLGIFIDLAFRDALFRGKTTLLWPVLGAALVAIGVSWTAARRIARGHLHVILPRFSEVDVPPPYREDGVARRVPGEALGRLLPLGPRTRRYFLRDLKQLRRRHRLDRVLLWVFAIAALKLAHDTVTGRSPAPTVLLALAMMNGVFIVSAFRLRGELASRWLDKTLPNDRGAELRGRLLATSHHPAVATLVAALATATTGDLAAAAIVLAIGLMLSAVLVVASHFAAALGAERPGLSATLWRVALAATVIAFGGLA